MQSKDNTPEEYLENLPEERRIIVNKLRKVILENLPEGFTEVMNYGMLGYVVPHSLYPAGYHCDPKQPLPFMNLSSQKNHTAVYHMGIYSDKELLNWFTSEYSKFFKTRLDIGKSCIRFKKADQIPFNLIGELAARISPQKWIEMYEKQIKR